MTEGNGYRGAGVVSSKSTSDFKTLMARYSMLKLNLIKDGNSEEVEAFAICAANSILLQWITSRNGF